MRMRYAVICGLLGSTNVLHIISQTARFSTEYYWKQNVCLDFIYNFCLKYVSFLEEMSEIWSKMHIGVHVKYPLFLSYFNEIWLFTTSFWKNIQISNLMETLSVVAMLLQADKRIDRRTDMTKLIVDFRNFANAHENQN